VRASGDVKGSAAGTLVGPKGTLVLGEGIIVADRHIHTPPTVAERLGLKNNQYVAARVFHTEKPMTLERVRIRIGEEFVLEMHLDNDDANAAGISSGDRVEVIH
jgi:putative phosphotransacetylase